MIAARRLRKDGDVGRLVVDRKEKQACRALAARRKALFKLFARRCGFVRLANDGGRVVDRQRVDAKALVGRRRGAAKQAQLDARRLIVGLRETLIEITEQL